MRIVKVVVGLLGVVALAGCIWVPDGRVSGGGAVVIRSDGYSGGPPPGHGWKK